ncbi:cytochrome P450 [Dermacoccaceae bacterium W4C1]
MSLDTAVKPMVRWGVQHALPRQVVRAAARRGDLQARLVVDSGRLSTEELSGLFSEIRGHGPLPRSRFARIATTHAECKEVLTSSDFRVGFPTMQTRLTKVAAWSESTPFHPVKPPSLLAVDGPDHTRYRKMVTRVFTARAVEGLRPRIEARAGELLDQLESRRSGPVDLVETFCSQLPVMVIAEILGVPDAERGYVLELGEGAAASLDMGLGLGQFRSVEKALGDFDQWLDTHLEHLRRNPGPDLMSALATSQDEEGGMSLSELKSTAGLVLAAGFETTVNLLGNAIVLLNRFPEQRQAARDGDAWGGVVDETLRFNPPVLLTARTSLRDTDVCGNAVAANSMVTTVLAAANRDPEVFADPDDYLVTRENARDHLAFGGGRHYCLGAALARMESEIGLRMLDERFPNLTLLPGAQRRSTRILRGFATIPALLG